MESVKYGMECVGLSGMRGSVSGCAYKARELGPRSMKIDYLKPINCLQEDSSSVQISRCAGRCGTGGRISTGVSGQGILEEGFGYMV